MTELADINFKNEDILKRNPELLQFVGSRPKKPSKWHNIKHMDPDGEVYGSGREAEHARIFVKAVQSGEYIAYLHHLWVTLPGGIRIELDHVLINNKFQIEVFDSKLYDEHDQKFICTDKWRVKQKLFEGTYGIKIQLI